MLGAWLQNKMLYAAGRNFRYEWWGGGVGGGGGGGGGGGFGHMDVHVHNKFLFISFYL